MCHYQNSMFILWEKTFVNFVFLCKVAKVFTTTSWDVQCNLLPRSSLQSAEIALFAHFQHADSILPKPVSMAIPVLTITHQQSNETGT